MNIVESFISGSSETTKDIVKNIVDILLKSNPEFDMDIKWKQLTFTINNDFNHWITAISITKKTTNLIFHYGGILDDPANILIVGNSKFLRKMEYKNVGEINSDIINGFIRQALNKRDYFINNWKQIQKSN